MWSPYILGKVPKSRSISTVEGLGDRLRFVAFAERQAALAFKEAASRFTDASCELREAWLWVSKEEEKHERWLLARMEELSQRVEACPVALDLYLSFERCHSAHEFALYMSNAEERGRVAGEKFGEILKERDPVTAKIFAQIAAEEREHVAMVAKFF
ncbi:MAG: ferritin-like domain-containing protein [Bacteriovoracaceae bacterium]|nr:ferritin-like domain-containing protein [Bacteriovoracaceae bacterium]